MAKSFFWLHILSTTMGVQFLDLKHCNLGQYNLFLSGGLQICSYAEVGYKIIDIWIVILYVSKLFHEIWGKYEVYLICKGAKHLSNEINTSLHYSKIRYNHVKLPGSD